MCDSSIVICNNNIAKSKLTYCLCYYDHLLPHLAAHDSTKANAASYLQRHYFQKLLQIYTYASLFPYPFPWESDLEGQDPVRVLLINSSGALLWSLKLFSLYTRTNSVVYVSFVGKRWKGDCWMRRILGLGLSCAWDWGGGSGWMAIAVQRHCELVAMVGGVPISWFLVFGWGSVKQYIFLFFYYKYYFCS